MNTGISFRLIIEVRDDTIYLVSVTMHFRDRNDDHVESLYTARLTNNFEIVKIDICGTGSVNIDHPLYAHLRSYISTINSFSIRELEYIIHGQILNFTEEINQLGVDQIPRVRQALNMWYITLYHYAYDTNELEDILKMSGIGG